MSDYEFGKEEFEIPEVDPDTEEDIREQIEERFAESEIPLAAERDIKKYLEDFNVIGAKGSSIQEIEVLWERLGRDPSLVRDFSYLISEKVTDDHLSIFPLAIHMNDVMYYAYRSNNPETIRPYLIKATKPYVARLGFNEIEYENLAEDFTGKRGEAARYLGWLTMLDCMGRLPHVMREYKKRHDVYSPDLFDIATVTMTELARMREALNQRASNYRTPEERKKLGSEIFVRATMGVNALYKRHSMLFLNQENDIQD